jgi:aspartate carbamoyltransferase catalytic subunit
MIFNHKHFLDLKTLTAQELYYILNTAQKMKYILTSNKGKSPELKGKTIATLFYEESSRSKVSYDLAAQNLSANIISLTTKRQFERGESLRDIGRTIDQMGVDFIVIRHPLAGGPMHLSKYVKASVINAGDGENENPTQALIDLLTILEIKHNFEGLKVAIIGDIKHNRVAKSNIWALKTLGAEVSVAGPPTFMPSGLKEQGVNVYYTITEALIDADVVLTLKVQTERQDYNLIPSVNEYTRLFKLDASRLKYAKPDAIVMHPGPINRGIEISSTVIDGESSLIDKQFINGVAVRMAIFHLLSKSGVNFYESTH